MNPRVLIQPIRSRLEPVYGARLKEVVLYGSVARGEADAGRDVDVLVVLDEVRHYGECLRRNIEALYAASEWERALLSLRSSEELLDTDPDSAASRAYYAAFHAVTALFALRDGQFSKHAALRSAVQRDLIHNGQWDVDLGKDYDFLMDLRETGDYGGLMHVSPEDARSAVQADKRIIRAGDKSSTELDVGRQPDR